MESLEILKTSLDVILCNLLSVLLLWQGALTRWTFEPQ